MQFMANDSGFGSANVDEALDTDPSVDRTLTVPAPGSSPFKTARMQGDIRHRATWTFMLSGRMRTPENGRSA